MLCLLVAMGTALYTVAALILVQTVVSLVVPNRPVESVLFMITSRSVDVVHITQDDV